MNVVPRQRAGVLTPQLGVILRKVGEASVEAWLGFCRVNAPLLLLLLPNAQGLACGSSTGGWGL